MNLSRYYHYRHYTINIYYEPRNDRYEAAVADQFGRNIFSVTAKTPDVAHDAAKHEINEIISRAMETARGEGGAV